MELEGDLEMDLKGDFEVNLEVGLEGDFRGDFKQDLEVGLFSSSGPGLVQFRAQANSLELDSEVGRRVYIIYIEFVCLSVYLNGNHHFNIFTNQ